jgi:GNAT superfamily N-acetyltransferase
MISIRPATIGDLEPLAILFDGYRVFYKQLSDIEGAKKFLRERIEKEESVIFVAEEEKELLGFTQLFPLYSSVGMIRTWLLNDLYVAANARKRGIASRLLQKAKEFGIISKSRWLLLQTSADNFTAQSVYESNGWQRVTDFFYEMPISE